MSTELERDLRIDPLQLDLEVIRHSEVYFKWARRANEGRSLYESAKMALEITQAELSSQARMDPEAFGITRVTEVAVDVAIKTSPTFQEKYEQMVRAKRECALLEQAVVAFDHRKKMLEALCFTFAQQWFADPQIPKDLSKRYRELVQKKEEKRAKKARQK